MAGQALTYPSEITSDSRSSPVLGGWLRRAGAVALPIILILLWAAAVRLPFYQVTDKDEFFFSITANMWLQGQIPYVAFYDLKPPGIFFLFAAVQSVFGASLLTIKAMEIVATGIGACLLYGIAFRCGSSRVALWVAILYPIYTLALGGVFVANLLLQLPFIILAFYAALEATAPNVTGRRALWFSLVAGLAIGAAGMVKQTAIFEAIALFAVLCVWRPRRGLSSMLALFVVGAALPALGFTIYFLAVGHFREMLDAVVLLALGRTGEAVLDMYGPDLAYNFTITGIVVNVVAGSIPFVFLMACGMLVLTRRATIQKAVPPRLLGTAGLWLAAGVASAMFGKGIAGYYLMVTVPPLLLLSGAFIGHGLRSDPGQWRIRFALALAAATVVMVFNDRGNILFPSPLFATDPAATREASDAILARNPAPDDRLLVLNRGFAVYLDTGLLPPAPVFHPIHTLGIFPTPYPDPLKVALDANPRFVVVADLSLRHITELASSYSLVTEYMAERYRPIASIKGKGDSLTVYEFAR